MIKIKILFQNLKDFVSSFKQLINLKILLSSKEISLKYIFFSENKTYQKFSKIIIDVLSQKFPNEVYYFSLDKNDKINHEGVKNFFIYNNYLAKFFFDNIKGENLFLTITDLDNHIFKKTNKIRNYIYYFHSPVSTIKNYTPKAFDNYDTILCNGKFQAKEIRFRENLKKINPKKIVNTGYFYFDYLKDKFNYKETYQEVLIAPSWNYSQNNFLNENFIELINILLKKGEKVIFRPHPEHFKRSGKILNKIKENNSNLDFYFDDNSENIFSMQKSKCLITDSSGIAFEYMIILKRPVLYLNESDKIHNTDINDYTNIEIIDNEIKNKFGYLFKKTDFNDIDLIIKNAVESFKFKSRNVDDFVHENFYNHEKTKIFLENNLDKIFQDQNTDC